jgi:hypothetical protein
MELIEQRENEPQAAINDREFNSEDFPDDIYDNFLSFLPWNTKILYARHAGRHFSVNFFPLRCHYSEGVILCHTDKEYQRFRRCLRFSFIFVCAFLFSRCSSNAT